MADYWVKLYIDILNDPKYHALSEAGKLGMLELMAVAKLVEMDGVQPRGHLPKIESIAFYTRRKVEWWIPVLEELQNHDPRPYLIMQDGDLVIRKYTTRQAAISDAERQRRSRNKSQFSHETVTSRDTEVEVDVDVEREVEKEEDEDASRDNDNSLIEFNQVFENATGLSRSNCTNKERSKWDAALAQFRKTGALPETIVNSVTALKSKGGYVIAGPWSIVKAVQIEMASSRKTVPKDDPTRYITGPYASLIQH